MLLPAPGKQVVMLFNRGPDSGARYLHLVDPAFYLLLRFPFETFGEPRYSMAGSSLWPFLPAVYHPFVLREAG